ncbi:hypothetical protein AMATHDRAFT_73315 [Amanita thiersii Skay4041]|uniref:Uncharacterized protein n=1 Tax=Amanita thiersii Skay4041 TaxID=703135 RepID=A0A2A9NVT1_9AGAR|nr:hypothetical protein AMATHDRAFT_73315 [Amanita thiersii Skay4041]
MIPEFSLRLQHGISGGFAPPTPNSVHTITLASAVPADSTSSLHITSAVREDGTPRLQEALPKRLSLAKESDEASLIKELHSILKEIPTESPPGIQDIYGKDMSIAWQSEDLMWYNGGPSGCGVGTSAVQPTDEHKKKFNRAVEIIQELVKKAQ